MADAALQAALEKIDELGEEDFREAKNIIELLRENLNLWKEEDSNNDNANNVPNPANMDIWLVYTFDFKIILNFLIIIIQISVFALIKLIKFKMANKLNS